MKKVLLSLTTVVAGAFMAGAAVPAVSPQKAVATPTVDVQGLLPLQSLPLTAGATRGAKAPVKAKSPITGEDYLGSYTWSGNNMLASEMFPCQGTFTITPSGLPSSDYLITGLLPGYPLQADFHPETGRLEVMGQWLEGDDIPTSTWFWNYSVEKVDYDGETRMEMKYTNENFYFTMDEEGNLHAGSIPLDAEDLLATDYTNEELEKGVCIAAVIPFNVEYQYYFLCSDITARPLTLFEFNPDDWTSIGNALFADAWFNNSLFGGAISPYDVPAYVSNSNPALFLLLDPYGPNTPLWDLNLSPDEGYILIDASDPDCVVVKPLVFALTIDMGGEDSPNPQPFYCFNKEGYYTDLKDYSAEETIVTLRGQGNTPSYRNGNTIYILNAVFTFGDDLVSPYQWNDGVMEGYIVLPGGNDGGEDGGDRPVDYYIIGANVNGNVWETGRADARFNYEGNGIYRWTGEILGSYFKINNGSWDNPAYDFGGDGSPITMNEPYTLVNMGYDIQFADFSYLLDPEVVLDINNHTVTLTGGTPMDNVTYYIGTPSGLWYGLYDYSPTLFGLSTYDGWTDGFYIVKAPDHGDYEYFGAKADSPYIFNGIPYSFGPIDSTQEGSILFAEFDAMFDVSFSLDLNINTVTMNAWKTFVYPDSDTRPKTLYLTDKYETTPMRYLGDGKYTCRTDLLRGPFTISAMNGNPEYMIGSTGTPMTVGESYEFVAGSSALPIETEDNMDIQDATLLLDLTDWTLLVSEGGQATQTRPATAPASTDSRRPNEIRFVEGRPVFIINNPSSRTSK